MIAALAIGISLASIALSGLQFHYARHLSRAQRELQSELDRALGLR